MQAAPTEASDARAGFRGQTMPDETRLVRQIQSGDRQAFAAFVDAYGARIHRLVKRYIANPTDAEDITQEI